MKRLLIAALSLTLALPAMAQQVSPSQLQAQLNQAMCAQNWSSAIANIDSLIAVGLDSASTQSLQTLRNQVVDIQASGQTFDSMPGWSCGGSSLNWDRAVEAVTTRSGSVNRGNAGAAPVESFDTGNYGSGTYSSGSSSGGSSGSGRCRVPSDTDSRGRRCGGRAASER